MTADPETGRIVRFYFQGPAVSDSVLKKLNGLKKLVSLSFYRTAVTAVGLLDLRRVAEIKTLSLDVSITTNEFLEAAVKTHAET